MQGNNVNNGASTYIDSSYKQAGINVAGGLLKRFNPRISPSATGITGGLFSTPAMTLAGRVLRRTPSTTTKRLGRMAMFKDAYHGKPWIDAMKTKDMLRLRGLLASTGFITGQPLIAGAAIYGSQALSDQMDAMSQNQNTQSGGLISRVLKDNIISPILKLKDIVTEKMNMNKYASVYIGSFNKVAASMTPGQAGFNGGAIGGLAGIAAGGIGGYLSGEDEDEETGRKGTRLRNALLGAGVLGGVGTLAGVYAGNKGLDYLNKRDLATAAAKEQSRVEHNADIASVLYGQDPSAGVDLQRQQMLDDAGYRLSNGGEDYFDKVIYGGKDDFGREMSITKGEKPFGIHPNTFRHSLKTPADLDSSNRHNEWNNQLDLAGKTPLDQPQDKQMQLNQEVPYDDSRVPSLQNQLKRAPFLIGAPFSTLDPMAGSILQGIDADISEAAQPVKAPSLTLEDKKFLKGPGNEKNLQPRLNWDE